jgi:hypothetical protein
MSWVLCIKIGELSSTMFYAVFHVYSVTSALADLCRMTYSLLYGPHPIRYSKLNHDLVNIPGIHVLDWNDGPDLKGRL